MYIRRISHSSIRRHLLLHLHLLLVHHHLWRTTLHHGLLLIDIVIEALVWIHLLDVTLHLFVNNVLFTVEVELLNRTNLLIKSFDLEFVGVNLTLVVFEFLNHLFELIGSLFQVLLIDLQLFSYFGTTLLSNNVLKLNVEFLFLLNKNIFL